MKVTCIDVLDKGIRYLWLTNQKSYDVIMLFIDLTNRIIKYNIIDDTGSLAYFDEKHFEVEDATISNDWIFRNLGNNSYELVPKIISYSDFLLEYHNGEAEALEKLRLICPEAR
jgi:hypothetical protein